MLGIANWRSQVITPEMQFFTFSGKARVWFSTAIVLNIFQINSIFLLPEQQKFLQCMLAALLAWGLGGLIKQVVRRPRPVEVISNYPVLTKQSGTSFPSSHTASAFAFGIALWKMGHPWALGATIWAALVSFSRFYLGVHFVSDIVGGVILGALCAEVIF